MKKIISTLLSIVLLFQNYACVLAAEENNSFAMVEFGSPDKLTNMTVNSAKSSVKYGGKYARRLETTAASNNLYIRCNVSDTYMGQLSDRTPIEITVEYFDEKPGKFSIQYDSLNPDTNLYTGNKFMRQTEVVTLNGTGEWLTHVFYLEDMRMGNGISSYDFRVAAYSYNSGFSDNPIAFHSIKAEKVDFRNLTDISVKTPYLGNIFSENDKQVSLDLNFYNKSQDTVCSSYTAKVYDKLTGEYVCEMSNSNVIEGKTTKADNFTFPNPGKNSIYSVVIEETTYRDGQEDNKKTRTYSTEFSVSVKLGAHEGDPYFTYQTQVISLGRGERDEVIALQTGFGASWNRDGVAWNTVEKEKGVLALPDGVYETLVKEKEMGIENLLICSKYNQFYDEGSTPYTPEGIAGYARYCGFLAKELKGVVNHFEIWNEYNHTPFNAGGTGPETYAEMLKQSYIAIKEANPDATVVGLGQANVDLRWSEEVFKAGGLEYCDAISCHPYDWALSFDEDVTLKNVLDLKALMNKYGYNKPMWITEVGFSTMDGVNPNNKNYIGYTQTEQAAGTVLLNTLFKAYNACDMMIGYCLYDRNNQADIESCWGLLYYWQEAEGYKPRNGAKESYLATAAMNKFTGGFNAEYKDIIEDGRFYAINFYNNKLNKNVLVMQSGRTAGTKIFNLNLGCQSVDLYDMYGNYADTIYSDDGIYSLEAGAVPYYALGTFAAFEQSTQSGSIVPDALTRIAAEEDYVEFNLATECSENLYVDVTCEDGIGVYENYGFQNQNAKIVLKTAKGSQGERWVRIRVCDDDGKTLYNVKHLINVENSLLSSIKFEQAVENYNTHWRAVVTVTNPANTSNISGTVELLSPQSIAEKSMIRRFTELEPGKTATFIFNMPVSVTKKVIPVSAKITLSTGVEDTVSKNMEVTDAYYAYTEPVIDGVVSDNEWSYHWFGADEQVNIRDLLDKWRGSDDLSFSGNIMWDEDYMYFLAVVNDDVHCVNYSLQTVYNMYKGDGIQFGIDDRENFAGGNETNFNEIGVAEFPGLGGTVFRYNTVYGLPDDSVIEGCETAVKRYDSYTVYETKIPWSGIFYESFKPCEGASYRFAALINDNDGAGRRGWIEYGQGLGSGKSVTKFGFLNLIK